VRPSCIKILLLVCQEGNHAVFQAKVEIENDHDINSVSME